MGWTDADAPEVEQQALRLCMALKNSLGAGWSDWCPPGGLNNVVKRAWVELAGLCGGPEGLWKCSPDVLYSVFAGLAAGHCPDAPWGELTEVERRAWLRVSLVAKDVWREENVHGA